eukprot:PhF_6_TR27188/c0_g1_i1/m.39928
MRENPMQPPTRLQEQPPPVGGMGRSIVRILTKTNSNSTIPDISHLPLASIHPQTQPTQRRHNHMTKDDRTFDVDSQSNGSAGAAEDLAMNWLTLTFSEQGKEREYILYRMTQVGGCMSIVIACSVTVLGYFVMLDKKLQDNIAIMCTVFGFGCLASVLSILSFHHKKTSALMFPKLSILCAAFYESIIICDVVEALREDENDMRPWFYILVLCLCMHFTRYVEFCVFGVTLAISSASLGIRNYYNTSDNYDGLRYALVLGVFGLIIQIAYRNDMKNRKCFLKVDQMDDLSIAGGVTNNTPQTVLLSDTLSRHVVQSINGIVGCAEIIRDNMGNLSGSELNSHTNCIIAVSNYIALMTTNAAMYSHLELGRPLEFCEEPLNVVEVLEDIVRNVTTMTAERGVCNVYLNVRCCEKLRNLCNVVADKDKLRFIFFATIVETVPNCHEGVDIELTTVTFTDTDVEYELVVKDETNQPARGPTLSMAGGPLIIAREILHRLHGDIEYTETAKERFFHVRMKLKRQNSGRQACHISQHMSMHINKPDNFVLYVCTAKLSIHRWITVYMNRYFDVQDKLEWVKVIQFTGGTLEVIPNTRCVVLVDNCTCRPEISGNPESVCLVTMRTDMFDATTLVTEGYDMCLRLPLMPTTFHRFMHEAFAGFEGNKIVSPDICYAQNMASAATPLPPLHSLDPLRPRALIVEDNPVNVRIFRKFLQGVGFDVNIAWNGDEAIRLVGDGYRWGQFRSAYNIVLMDIEMPVRNGWHATRSIREQERTMQQEHKFPTKPHVPIIVITGRPQDQELLALKDELEVEMVLAKPTKKQELLDAVKRYQTPCGVDSSGGDSHTSSERSTIRARFDPVSSIVQEIE